jgi:DNA-binding PadR family transcriptional regulator
MAARDLVMNRPTEQVLVALLAEPTRDHHGAALLRATGLSAGRVYPVLSRLELLQWLDSGWEQPTRHEQGWPRRRYYRLSAQGLAMARGALASARASPSLSVNRLRPASESG